MASGGDDSKMQGSSGRRLPPNAGKGRKKGVPNKLTKTIREAIETAFSQAGAEEYLLRQAEENPQSFMGLLSKLLPSQIQAEVSTDVASVLPDGLTLMPKNFSSREMWDSFSDQVKRQPDAIVIRGGLVGTEDVFPIVRRVAGQWVCGGIPSPQELASYDLDFGPAPEPIPPA